MAQTKTKPARVTDADAAAHAARKATRDANASLDIDYTVSRSENQFSASGRQSFWVTKLNKLAEDCADPESGAEFGEFYRIGTFSQASTAQSTRRRIETEHVDELVGVFALKTARYADSSELWAAAYEEDEPGDDDTPKTRPVAGDDGDEWGTE